MKELVAEIVAAYLRNNEVAPSELPRLITTVSETLSTLGAPPSKESQEPAKPAVSIRRSVTPNAIICLECGFGGKMIRRHVASRHGLSAEEYRAKWTLPDEYPLTAPNYAKMRSDIAKESGLGAKARKKEG